MAATLAHASVVFDNGGPNQLSGNEMTAWIQAQSFSLATTDTVQAVQFWAVAATGSYTGSITYSIYNNNAGVPGIILASGRASPVAVPTGGGCCDGLTEYLLDFNLASGFTATAGTTYWFGLSPSTTSRLDFYWEDTSGGLGLAPQEFAAGASAWDSNTSQHAFQLFDTSVPEPGAFGIMGLGLARLR
jgi:hypothetical protein